MRVILSSTLRLLVLGGLIAAWPVQARAAVVLDFSDRSSDETPASVLNAVVSFATSGNQLLIDINNLSNYDIAQLYFNADPTLTALAFTGPTSWKVQGTGRTTTYAADGMGSFNFVIDFGKPATWLDPGTITSLSLTMSGTTSDAGFLNLSTIPPGQYQEMSVLKFQSGPNDDSAFGGTSTVVPEPATLLLVGSGIALAARRRRKA